MKTLITPNLLKFSAVVIVLTVLFRMSLSASLTNEIIILTLVSSVVYGILMWFNGKYFGEKEYEYLPIYDVGLRFHISTFLGHNFISILWFMFGFQSSYERIIWVYVTALIWSVFLLIHLFYFLSIKKRAIKNLDKNDLFE